MTRRRWIILAVLLCILVPYVSSYFYISRKYWAEWRAVRATGFMYMSPAAATAPDAITTGAPAIRHRNFCILYYPINQIDGALGGPGVIACLLTEIGEPKPK
jgi:hypothetical protein